MLPVVTYTNAEQEDSGSLTNDANTKLFLDEASGANATTFHITQKDCYVNTGLL